MHVGARIASWRKFRDLSQRALADAVEVTAAAVYQWESGATTPSLSSIEAIAKALAVSMSEFFGQVPKKRAA